MKKKVIVEARYVGEDLRISREWFEWNRYRSASDATNAKTSAERQSKFKDYEYRIKP